MVTPKQPMLLPRLLVADHKLKVKLLLLKIMPIQLTGHGKVEMVLTWSLHSYGLEDTLHATKGERQTDPEE